MSLKEYAKKRHFNQTPEPPPGTPERAPKAVHGGRFFIQRHLATRLHYDFRLEIEGVLKSWAVPKGPTLDAAPKRLAAMVEDHPLDYGDFEGNIPAGNYGGGSVMLWDRGTYELVGDEPAMDQIRRGDLKFMLHGEKLQGYFGLVLMKGRGKGNEWLLLKKKDDRAQPGWDIDKFAFSVKTGRTQEEIAADLKPEKSVKTTVRMPEKALETEMPESIVPMQAMLAKQPPKGDEWLFEIKWDGVRALSFIDDGQLRIFSRTGNRCERQYPELSILPHFVEAKRAILDGEIAALDEHGVANFGLIQPRIANQDASAVAHMARRSPVHLFLFDLIYLDGYDLRRVPLEERKRLLRSVLKLHELIRFSDHFPGGEDIVEAARQQGLEGVMAKCKTSCYEPKRSRDWLKIKLVSEQEFLICGYTEGERDYFGSLVLGVYESGKLEYAGNVGTGFDRKLMASIHDKMQPLRVSRAPFADPPKIPGGAIWVKPELVCEVKFSNWTKDGRLRAPVFLGLRDDVNPQETVRERPVADDAPAPERQTLLTGTADEVSLTVDGRPLKFTHLNKVFYPAERYTKRDLLNYYDRASGLLLPYIKDRPLSLKRYPNGIEDEHFFQKDTPRSFAPWLRFEPVWSEQSKKTIRFVLAEDRASILYLTNLGCIDQNPWMSRVGLLENPDFILIDLDPQECSYDLIVEAACLVRKKLDAVGLEGYPKTTGGDGLHIYVPVEPRYTYSDTKSFAEVLARLAAVERPDLFTTPRPVQKREKGKVYFDYLQNGEGKTIAAPYVVRAYAGAPVATPLAWNEVKKGLDPKQFHIRNAIERFDRVGDLFRGVLENLQTLEEPLARLAALVKKG